MKRKGYLAALVVVVAALWTSEVAQAEPSQLDAAVRLSKSKSWSDRKRAAEQLLGMREDPNSRLALIVLLRHEVQSREQATGQGDEEFAEYFENLLLAVSQLGDPRSLDILTSPTLLCTGNGVTHGIAAMGHPAVDIISERLKNAFSLSLCERDALVTASRYLMLQPISPGDRARLVSLSMKAAQDPSPLIRIGAARALLASKDPGAQKVAQRLATTDPYVVHSDSRDIYPVRDAAAGRMDAPTNIPGQFNLK